VTGTAACSPSRAVRCSRARQAVALSDTATCDGATRATLSVPHSIPARAGRCGADIQTSHRPKPAPEATIRSSGGALTVSILVSGCGPVSRTSRLVRAPAGTGTCTVPPACDQRPVCPSPVSDTASRLRASTCRPAVPAGAVTRIVTVFEAGDNAHATRNGTGAAAGPERPRQPTTSAASDSKTTASTVRRSLNCRVDGRA
jgi:hypothetical protein